MGRTVWGLARAALVVGIALAGGDAIDGCSTTPPPGCSSDADCHADQFCGGGQCTSCSGPLPAAGTSTGAHDADCPGDFVCNPTGHCVFGHCGYCDDRHACTATSTFCDPSTLRCAACSSVTLTGRPCGADAGAAACDPGWVCDPSVNTCVPGGCPACSDTVACAQGKFCEGVSQSTDNAPVGLCEPCSSYPVPDSTTVGCASGADTCGLGEQCNPRTHACVPPTCPGLICDDQTPCADGMFCLRKQPSTSPLKYGVCRPCPTDSVDAPFASCSGTGQCLAGEVCDASGHCQPLTCKNRGCDWTTPCDEGEYCKRNTGNPAIGQCTDCPGGGLPDLGTLPACSSGANGCFVEETCDARGNLDGVCIPSTCGAIPDAGGDASVDAGGDGGTDSGTDGSSDAGEDAGADGSADAGVDGSADGSVDAGADGSADAGADGGADAQADAGPDATVDAGSDAGATFPSGTGHPTNLMLQKSTLFWQDTQHVYAMPVSGGASRAIVQDNELAAYTTDGTNVYWWGQQSQAIQQAPVANPASIVPLASSQPPGPYPRIAVDSANVYWVANTSGGATLRRTGLGGAGGVVDMVQPIDNTTLANMIAVGGNVYIADRANAFIRVCPILDVVPNGSCSFDGTQGGPNVIHADDRPNLFWLGFDNTGGGSVSEIKLGTTTSLTVLPTQSGAFFDFALGGAKLLFGTDQIYAVPEPPSDGGAPAPGPDGGAPVPVAPITSGYVATDIVADGAFVYWLEYDQVNTRYAIRRAAY
jgi:hypothetical protein